MFQITLRETARQMGRKTVAMSIAEALQYLLITVKLVSLEKVSFSDKKILRLFFNTLTVNDKHYLLNRENLRQSIQMQLSEKLKTFSQFFFFFFLHFKNLY